MEHGTNAMARKVGMRPYIKLNMWFIFLVIFTTSCNSQKEPSPEQQKVIEKTKNNFVFVEGGTFMMGKNALPEANPTHHVTLGSYSISKYETTFKEFDLYSELNDLEKVAPNWRNQNDMGPNYGVIKVHWQLAQDYCKWLGKQLQLPIDLPTEAQWEYAARSRGLDVQHATDSGKIEGSYTEKRNYDGSKVAVGSFPANPLGLYDMSGGRPEWVWDWFTGYSEGEFINPVQDTIKWQKTKVIRGWHSLSNSVYKRGKRPPENDGSGVGFRCVCNQKTPVN